MFRGERIVKINLVEDWRNFHQWWSVRWNALGAVLLPALVMVPSMPPEIQALIPAPYRAAAAALYMAGGIALRLMAQKRA